MGEVIVMKKLGNMLFWIVVIGVVLFAAYAIYNKNKPSDIARQTSQNSSLEAGAGNNEERPTAPEIILKDLNGKTVKLSDYRGKVVILNFWASWCPPCREEMPELDQANKEFEKSNDAVLLSVDLTDGVRETVEKANKFISDNKYSMRVLLDTEGLAADEYEITNIPTTYIIDKQGKVYDRIVGPTSKDALMDYVSKLT
jgi:cytochrome c-type biogenesis protein